jgi:DNA mismatch repair protein MutL
VRFSHERSVYGAVSAAVNDVIQEYPRQAASQEYSWPFADWSNGGESQVGEGSTSYLSGCAHALAQLHNTYILAQVPDGLVIVDQHAAHEQVLYEQLCHSREPLGLSPPARLDLTLREAGVLEQVAILLSEIGIHVEPFGGNSFLIRTLPGPLSSMNPVDLVEALVAERIPRQAGVDEQRQRLTVRASCMGALKAGDPLTIGQMQSLLDELLKAWSPANCPHGRPTLVSISMEELSRRFFR